MTPGIGTRFGTRRISIGPHRGRSTTTAEFPAPTSRTRMSQVCPTAVVGLPGTAGSVGYGYGSATWCLARSPESRGILRNPGVALAMCAAPFRRESGPVSPGVRGRRTAWRLTDPRCVRADQAARARQRRRTAKATRTPCSLRETRGGSHTIRRLTREGQFPRMGLRGRRVA